MTGARQDEGPGELDGRRRFVAGRGYEDAALRGRLHVDRGVARSGGRDKLEPRQLLQDFSRQRGPFAHDADGIERTQPLDERGGISDVIVEYRDLRAPSDCRPIGQPQGHILIVVEDRNFHRTPSAAIEAVTRALARVSEVGARDGVLWVSKPATALGRSIL